MSNVKQFLAIVNSNAEEAKKRASEAENVKDKETATEDENKAESKKTDGETGKSKQALARDESFIEDKYFASQIAKWENLKKGSYVKIGIIGDKNPIHMVGMPSGVLRYDVNKLMKNMQTHGDFLTVDLLKQIPGIIANPIAISQFKEDNTISVFGEIFVGNSPVMVGITISKDRAGNDISKVRTYNARRDVASLITDSTVLYLNENKKRTLAWFQACGIQVPFGGNTFGFIRSISQPTEKVKSKLSTSSDTEAEKATQEPTERDSRSDKAADGEAAPPVEGGAIGNEDEIRKAAKLVKGFDTLHAEQRNAIVRMMRSANGIEKITVSSIANIMASRPGLHVRFTDKHANAGSFDKLKDGSRLVLLNPEKKNGKHWRADILFHELYHEMRGTGVDKTVENVILEKVPKDYARAIVDAYTEYYNGISVTDWLNGRRYTKANYDAYFEEHQGITQANMDEEIVASAMGRIMASGRFIGQYRGNVSLIGRIFYGLSDIARSLANRSVQIGGDDSHGFTLAFRDILSYKRMYEEMMIVTQYKLNADQRMGLAAALEDRDEADEEVAKKYALGDEDSSENQYTYEALTSKPDMVITALGDDIPESRADTVNKAKKNVASVGKASSDGSVSVYVKDVDRDVIVNTDGIRHSLDRRFSINAPVAAKAGEILKHSIRINELIPQKDEAKESYVLIGVAKNNDEELYIVRSVINSFRGELVSMDVLYAINAKTEPSAIKKRNQPGAYPQDSRLENRFLTDSTISIAELLDYVNRYFPDVLPWPVLRYYGHSEKPQTKIGKSTKYSLSLENIPEKENFTIRANAEKETLEVVFSDKPPKNVLEMLKSKGFRWSPKNRVWYGQEEMEELRSALNQAYSDVTKVDLDELIDKVDEEKRKKAEDKLEEALRGYGMKDAEIKRHLSIYHKGAEINRREKRRLSRCWKSEKTKMLFI